MATKDWADGDEDKLEVDDKDSDKEGKDDMAS